MKELSIEEKAKRYDEAIKKVEVLYKTAEPMSGCNVLLETVFPELAESEDEKIRKALINGFNKLDKSAVWYNGITNAQILDWLEKQGEHANFRNKIQIGDKVTKNRDGYLVNLSQLNRVAKVEEKQSEQKSDDKVEPKFHEGDIIKPKDGGHEPWQIMQVDIFDKKYRFKNGYVVLFSQEDAYELVEQKPTDEEMKRLLQTEYEKGRADAIAEKSWSEEDEDVLEEVEEAIINYWHGQSQKDLLDWLKSLKDRVQPKQEWSEEDKEMFEYALDMIEWYSGKNEKRVRLVSDWLKSLRPQNTWKPSDEQIEILDMVLTNESMDDNIARILRELQEALKKLKGE